MCYYLKTQHYINPLFNNVDATYIIHLEGNTERYKNITEQLEMYHPTKIVHILFNKGYKKCNTNANDSIQDIINTYLYIMNDANKYNTILILEDDFMFNKDVHNHTKNIETFINNNTTYIYRLGCLPVIQVPYNTYTYMGISIGAHSILYSKSIRNTILNDKNNISDWDLYINFISINYNYYKPLCYQLFGNTENQSNWGTHNKILHFITQYFVIAFIKLIGIDKKAEPGYTIIYTISKILTLIILFIILKILI